MRRILLVDDDNDHEVLLRIMAEDAGAKLVARIPSIEALPSALEAHLPHLVILDVWLGNEISLDHIDEVIKIVGELPLVLWTHDPWTARQKLKGYDLPMIDKMAPREDLIAVLQG